MSEMASQITSLTIVYSTVYSRRRSKKTSKFRVTGLCAGNSPVTGEFPAQMASNAGNVSIWWRHRVMLFSKKLFVKLRTTTPMIIIWGKVVFWTSKFCVTGLCAGNSPVTGEFPAQRDSDEENVSIWSRHHVDPGISALPTEHDDVQARKPNLQGWSSSKRSSNAKFWFLCYYPELVVEKNVHFPVISCIVIQCKSVCWIYFIALCFILLQKLMTLLNAFPGFRNINGHTVPLVAIYHLWCHNGAERQDIFFTADGPL